MEKPDSRRRVYWVCQVCGYVAVGAPPVKCPSCGASGGNFKKVEE